MTSQLQFVLQVTVRSAKISDRTFTISALLHQVTNYRFWPSLKIFWVISGLPGRERGPRNHPESSSQKLADFECKFPYDYYGRERAPFWPFLGQGFWGSIRRPLVLPAPLLYF